MQRNNILKAEVAKRLTLCLLRMDYMIRSENDANIDTSIITTPWQRNNIHKAVLHMCIRMSLL